MGMYIMLDFIDSHLAGRDFIQICVGSVSISAIAGGPFFYMIFSSSG